MAKKTGTKAKSKAAKASSSAKVPKPRKPPEEVKHLVVSFRVTPDRHKEASDSMKGTIGCNSVSEFGRKLLADFLAGRLAYKKPEYIKFDFDKNPEALDSLK